MPSQLLHTVSRSPGQDTISGAEPLGDMLPRSLGLVVTEDLNVGGAVDAATKGKPSVPVSNYESPCQNKTQQQLFALVTGRPKTELSAT